MRFLTVPVLICLLAQNQAPTQWTAQTSGVTARLRGVSAVNEQVVWASGSAGTILRTENGGATWKKLVVPGTEKLDFRDIDAVSARTAYALSIGAGEQSRIYKTADAGASWTEQYVNRDPKAFFDAMAFWDTDRGIAVSDSVDGQFVILMTRNGGRNWSRVPPDLLPAALPGEGAFAASGTNVAMHGRNHVWVGTGAAAQARVLRSNDGGQTWKVATTPLAAGPSSGIFSVAFRDGQNGIVVGGDYRKESEAVNNAAITTDGGITWTAVSGLTGFRSVVAYVPRARRATLLAVGPSGADYSEDDGRHWTPVPGAGFHAFSFSPTGRFGWGVGENGSIGRLAMSSVSGLETRD
jgi:photosystem II stability/assembly factor-like uncharacterized protein